MTGHRNRTEDTDGVCSLQVGFAWLDPDGSGAASAKALINRIREITAVPEIGRIYEGEVRTIKEFGAFVQILPGTDGMVHISELTNERVKNVTDVVKEGDIIKVKVIDVDNRGRIRLSRKAALAEGEK